MPTENEFKYVLDPHTDEAEIRNRAHRIIEIEQAYLVKQNPTIRLRKTAEGFYEPNIRHYFCFKQQKDDRVIEIECGIDKRDFEDLWDDSTNKLVKTRYVLGAPRNLQWEVDFFKRKDNGEVYFVMVECEVPEDVKSPPEPLPIIADQLIYTVFPQVNPDFSSRKMACPAHASKMLKNIEIQKKTLDKT